MVKDCNLAVAYTVCHFAHAQPIMLSILLVVNRRRACAARVTVVVLSFCLSVTTFSAATSNKAANKRY